MDKNSTPNNPASAPQTSPEEDTTLLAIEALEARSVDPNPEPWSPTPRPAPIPTPIVAAKPLPIVQPEPSKVARPAPLQVMSPEPKVIVKTKPEPVAPAPIVLEKPKKPLTPAEEMAEELANAPARSYFQFFLHQSKPRKVFIIISIAIVIIGIGIGAYLALR